MLSREDEEGHRKRNICDAGEVCEAGETLITSILLPISIARILLDMAPSMGTQIKQYGMNWMPQGQVSVRTTVRRPATQLREYQKQALAEIRRLYASGVRRQILSMPTGLGKTVIFTRLHKELNFRKRVLVIAHRRELIDQTVEHYRRLGYRFGNERTDAWYRNVSSDKRIWIATVQSLTHPQNRRVQRLAPKDFDLVICDEAHHSVAASYMFVCDHFGITKKHFAGLFLGVTATPVRNDRKSLGSIFDQAVCVIDVFKAIEEGWLVGIRYFQAHSRISLANLQTDARGEFNLNALGRRINQDARNSLIFKAWKEKAPQKRTIAFCATVEHAVNVAATFRKHGVAAEAIHGRLSLEDRARILREHREGKITVLANCEILTEGYDDPDVECIIMARPTQSQPLYVQMIGRGLRLPTGIDNLKEAAESGRLACGKKSQCIIIDVVDNCARHDLEVVTALSLYGNPVGGAADAPARGVPPPDSPNGHAPTPEIFDAVHPRIEEIDLLNIRSRAVQNGKPSPTRARPVTPGPLATWDSGTWDECYKRQLHQWIVSRWALKQGGPPPTFQRARQPEYGLTISHCAPGSWTLSCNSGEGTRYARNFVNVLDAFGCGEYFVSCQQQERDLRLHNPRTLAALPIQKALLKICEAEGPEATKFGEAQRRIMLHMNHLPHSSGPDR